MLLIISREKSCHRPSIEYDVLLFKQDTRKYLQWFMKIVFWNVLFYFDFLPHLCLTKDKFIYDKFSKFKF